MDIRITNIIFNDEKIIIHCDNDTSKSTVFGEDILYALDNYFSESTANLIERIEDVKNERIVKIELFFDRKELLGICFTTDNGNTYVDHGRIDFD